MPRKPDKRLESARKELQKIMFAVMPLGRFGLVVEGEKPSASVERIVAYVLRIRNCNRRLLGFLTRTLLDAQHTEKRILEEHPHA